MKVSHKTQAKTDFRTDTSYEVVWERVNEDVADSIFSAEGLKTVGENVLVGDVRPGKPLIVEDPFQPDESLEEAVRMARRWSVRRVAVIGGTVGVWLVVLLIVAVTLRRGRRGSGGGSRLPRRESAASAMRQPLRLQGVRFT